MPNLIEIPYEQTGASAATDALGMREMQARAFEARGHQYILLKAPPDLQKAIVNQAAAAVVNRQLIPKIVMETFPDLTQQEVGEVTDHVLADTLFSHGKQSQEGDKRFINFARQFIDLDDLHIDMIYKINPFQHAYEVLSKSLDKEVLAAVPGVLATQKAKITEEELNANWHLVEAFEAENGCLPNYRSKNPFEERLGLMVQKARQLFLAANQKDDLELS